MRAGRKRAVVEQRIARNPERRRGGRSPSPRPRARRCGRSVRCTRRWRRGSPRRDRRRSSAARRSRPRGRAARPPRRPPRTAPVPRARKAAIMPESTSPVPALASQAGAGGAKPRRPSGDATSVSGPLNTTTASRAACVAASARSGLEPSTSPKSFRNSPSCGVRIAPCPLSRSGSPSVARWRQRRSPWAPSAGQRQSLAAAGYPPCPGPTSRQPMRSFIDRPRVSVWTTDDGKNPSIRARGA